MLMIMGLVRSGGSGAAAQFVLHGWAYPGRQRSVIGIDGPQIRARSSGREPDRHRGAQPDRLPPTRWPLRILVFRLRLEVVFLFRRQHLPTKICVRPPLAGGPWPARTAVPEPDRRRSA